MRWLVRSALAIVVAATTAFVGYSVSADEHAAASNPALGPGLVTVDVGIHYSQFSFSTLRVRTGTLVRFLVHNDDPIHHEFIVGDASVHARHAHGSEATHPPVPGEGSAIFFHIRRGESRPTSGCTTMAEGNLVHLITWLRAPRHPCYVLLPESEYQKKWRSWNLPAPEQKEKKLTESNVTR